MLALAKGVTLTRLGSGSMIPGRQSRLSASRSWSWPASRHSSSAAMSSRLASSSGETWTVGRQGTETRFSLLQGVLEEIPPPQPSNNCTNQGRLPYRNSMAKPPGRPFTGGQICSADRYSKECQPGGRPSGCAISQLLKDSVHTTRKTKRAISSYGTLATVAAHKPLVAEIIPQGTARRDLARSGPESQRSGCELPLSCPSPSQTQCPSRQPGRRRRPRPRPPRQ